MEDYTGIYELATRISQTKDKSIVLDIDQLKALLYDAHVHGLVSAADITYLTKLKTVLENIYNFREAKHRCEVNAIRTMQDNYVPRRRTEIQEFLLNSSPLSLPEIVEESFRNQRTVLNIDPSEQLTEMIQGSTDPDVLPLATWERDEATEDALAELLSDEGKAAYYENKERKKREREEAEEKAKQKLDVIVTAHAEEQNYSPETMDSFVSIQSPEHLESLREAKTEGTNFKYVWGEHKLACVANNVSKKYDIIHNFNTIFDQALDENRLYAWIKVLAPMLDDDGMIIIGGLTVNSPSPHNLISHAFAISEGFYRVTKFRNMAQIRFTFVERVILDKIAARLGLSVFQILDANWNKNGAAMIASHETTYYALFPKGRHFNAVDTVTNFLTVDQFNVFATPEKYFAEGFFALPMKFSFTGKIELGTKVCYAEIRAYSEFTNTCESYWINLPSEKAYDSIAKYDYFIGFLTPYEKLKQTPYDSTLIRVYATTARTWKGHRAFSLKFCYGYLKSGPLIDPVEFSENCMRNEIDCCIWTPGYHKFLDEREIPSDADVAFFRGFNIFSDRNKSATAFLNIACRSGYIRCDEGSVHEYSKFYYRMLNDGYLNDEQKKRCSTCTLNVSPFVWEDVPIPFPLDFHSPMEDWNFDGGKEIGPIPPLYNFLSKWAYHWAFRKSRSIEISEIAAKDLNYALLTAGLHRISFPGMEHDSLARAKNYIQNRMLCIGDRINFEEWHLISPSVIKDEVTPPVWLGKASDIAAKFGPSTIDLIRRLRSYSVESDILDRIEYRKICIRGPEKDTPWWLYSQVIWPHMNAIDTSPYEFYGM